MKPSKLIFGCASKILVLVFIASLIGCSSSPTASYKSKASSVSSAEYQAQKNSNNFGVPVNKLSGKYSGVYYCNNIPVRFTLDLKVDAQGVLSGSMLRDDLVYRRGFPAPGTKTSEASIGGQYNEAASTLKVVMRNMNNQPHNVYYHRSASLQGVLLPDASAFVLYDTSPTGQTCSAWIAQRGDGFPDDWAFLKSEARQNKKPDFFDGFSVKSERSSDQTKKTCDAKLLGWLKESEQIPMPQSQLHNHYIRTMYRDKYFEPHFGKSFLELSTAERMIYSIRLNGSCSRYLRTQANKRRSPSFYWTTYVMQSFGSQSTIADVDKAISLIGFELTDTWFRLGKAHYAQMAEQQGDLVYAKQFLASSQFMIKRMMPKEQDELVAYANTQIGKMIMPELKRNLDAELAGLSMSFASLDNLASFEDRSKKAYPAADKTELQKLGSKIGSKVNQSAPAAAKQYAQEARRMDGIRSLNGWQQQYPNLVLILNASNKNQIDTLFVQRRTQIAGEILRDEKRAFQQAVVQQGMTSAAMFAGVRYESAFKQQYGAISNEAGFAEFASERQAARNKILVGASNQMIKIINQTKHQRTFSEVEASYLLANDKNLPAAKKILAAADSQRVKVAPFGNGKFEIYLNAVYTYDYDRLREMDRISTAPIAASMRSIMPAMQGVGVLMEAITGGAMPVRKMMEAEQKKLEQASLIYPTMAFYVLNYEKYNAQCVESDAVPMVVKYRWTEYETNGGVRREIDSGGRDTHYKVNRRFLPAFNVIYKSDGDDTMKKFADRFFKGNNKIYRDELIDGTYTLMQKSCKGKIIKHIERQMIRYFNDVKGRMDTISREVFR